MNVYEENASLFKKKQNFELPAPANPNKFMFNLNKHNEHKHLYAGLGCLWAQLKEEVVR